MVAGVHQALAASARRLGRAFARGAGLVGVVASITSTAQAQQKDSNPHGKIDVACATCHTADGWKPVKIQKAFNHGSYGFVLDGGHASVTCGSCHKSLVFSQATKTCASCHQDIHKGELGVQCADCHNTRSFTDRSTQVAAHALTRFPLDGAHRTVDCRNCHTSRSEGNLVFRGTPTDCISCHQRDFDQTTSPNHPAAGFKKDCTACHSIVTWQGGRFDHQTTQFPLAGAHLSATCDNCHADRIYRNKPTTCVSCHLPAYTQSKLPPHDAARFPTDCASCHTTTKWQGAPYDHNLTKFPLTGAHLPLTCQACHADQVFVGKATTCVSCHQPDWAGTKTPPHQAAGFPIDCTTCHTTAKWLGATFDHSRTKFPLTGSHVPLTCLACHADQIYVGKPTTCVSCHQPDYTKTSQPPHQAAGFPTDCATCHTTTKWPGAVFDHNKTQFPLTGAHVATACMQCHADGVYRGKPTTCVSCHQPDYAKTSQPPHQAAGFPTDCATCHTTTRWPGAIFDHNKTQFPLTGSHVATPCMQCHADGVYKGKPTACVSCHQPDYDKSSQPPHKAAGFPTTCTLCHATTKWIPGTFDHNASQFPLTGAHLATPCMQCHADGVYKGKPTACVSCHQPEFDNSTDPNHKAALFPTTCATCHTTTKWPGVPYNHSATQFPLTGAHIPLRCKDCHADGVYKGKPTACVSCHQTDYAKTSKPPHQTNGIGTNCASCHTTTQWPGGTFDHTTTPFPLTGTHATTPCMQCHSDGVYKGKPTTCVSCHQADYNATTNPNHTAAHFPTTCASCHNTTQWPGATFNHDGQFFPIYSGNHKGQWASCATCHTNPADYLVFTCLSCHEHSQIIMDPKHSQVNGYQYNSTKCYSCHPRG